MRYSIEHADRIYVGVYGFLSFAENIGTHAIKVSKCMSNKYRQKLLDSAKKSTADAIKLFQKEQIKKLQKQLVI